MSPVLVNAAVTLALVTLTAALFGGTGTYYLVTTAGLPHFIIAFVFAAISVRHGSAHRRHVLLGLAGLAVIACAVYARFPIPDLVGAYFVVHMFRDEVYMYLTRRAGFDPVAVARAGDGLDGPSGGGGPEGLGRAWIAGRILIVVALAAFALGRLAVARRAPAGGGLFVDPFTHLSGSTPKDLLIGLLLIVVVAGLAAAPRRIVAFLHLPAEARELLTLFILVAFIAYLREATLFLAMFHYVSWYFFYGEKLRHRQAVRVPAGEDRRVPFWQAVMSRPRPFAALMITANGVAMAGLILYLRHPVHLGVLAGGYEYSWFAYWTIPHVTLSFVPRR